MSIFIVFISLVSNLSSMEIMEMDSMYQYSQESVVILEDVPQILDAFRYGLWSKYNPLANILQVGSVGLFDSDCFHLHSALEEFSQSLNLIYYDCVDYTSKKIQKTISFIDNDDMQHTFTIDIDPFEYENVWYFFEIVQWPLLQRFELRFIYKQETFFESLKIRQPFQDHNLKLIFGGGMIVSNSKIVTITPGTKFAYFPGKLIKVQYNFEEISIDEDQEWLARTLFEPYEYCYCYINDILRFEDITINWLDNEIIISQNTNCDSFSLSGWLKITDIIQSSDDFIYQFITLTSNFQNSLANKNLSPFSLSYKISQNKNQIIVRSYSYTFPSATINFSEDPYLITKEFDLINTLSLWQKLQIQLFEDQLIINIKFYEDHNIYDYNIEQQVNQFKCTQFKLQYGNTLQSTENYLKIIVKFMEFDNCDTFDTLQICHHSCFECDGPTQNNCLSCLPKSERIYLPEFKACICPYHTIDEITCKSYKNSKIQLTNERKMMPKCKYGYFEYEDGCIHCPSIINDQLATCQDCLQNPQGWSKNPYCEYDFWLNKNGDVGEMQWLGYQIYYLFDGNDLIQCLRCNQFYSFFVEEQEIPNLQITVKQKFIGCQLELRGCAKCIIIINGIKCIQCFFSYKLVDGVCIQKDEYLNPKFCLTPYYVTSKRECNLCPILHCKYCFEYQANDLSKCTLYNNFVDFDSEIEAQIGCALCEDNFIFNFITGTCKYDTPKIKNCLRSFIYNGEEICTLSQIDDFNVAPEIINCQKHQSHCLQCVLSPEFIIKCIICQVGYAASISNGDCQLSDSYQSKGAKIIIEGVYSLKDGWVQRIQSFMMKFLPNKYFYFQPKLYQYVDKMIVECQEFYQTSNYYRCYKYCDSQCQECKLNSEQKYYCNRCPLNQYYQPIRDQIDGICSECSQLCQACSSRTSEELYSHQPFVVNDQNFIHTKKCLKPLQDPQIYLDPYDQIAKYCFDQTCSRIFIYPVEISFCDWFDITWEKSLNIKYLNQLGIDTLIMNFNFTYSDPDCTIYGIEILSQLKEKVFSLKYVHFLFTSKSDLIMIINKNIKVNNIDKFEINQIIHYSKDKYSFTFQNNHEQVELSLFNFTILGSQIQNIQSIFKSEKFGDVHMKDVYLVNANFVNSSMLNLTDYLLQGIVQIDRFVIRNCNFINTNLFQFTNNKLILIVKNFIIEDCEFTNSSIFFIDSNLQQLSILDFYNITVKQSNFTRSSLLNCQNYVTLSLIYFQFQSNQLLLSKLIVSNYNLSLSYFKVQKNIMIDSQFIQMLEKFENQPSFAFIDQFDASQNSFVNSIFFKLYTTQEFSLVELSISNLTINEMVSLDNSDENQYLFQIRCSKLKMQEMSFKNLKNCFIFYIFDTDDILVQKVVYENPNQVYKVPFSQACEVKINDKNQMLKIENFYTLIINLVQIINQFTIDGSFLDLSQKKGFTNSAKLEIIDLTFKGNLQLYKESTRLFSLLTLYSEWSLKVKIDRITFLENCFHSKAEGYFQSFASLFFFNIKSSNIEISNLLSERNAFTNSSNSFIYIYANTITIQNLQVSNHNILSKELWERFYGLKFDKFVNQQQINQVIFETLNISNIGGVGQVKASILTCLNCNFQNILALKSFIFEIMTTDYGIIKFNYLIANNVMGDLKQDSNSSGCISIFSQDSYLDLEISNSSFSNVSNRMSPSILSIQPSQLKNKISLTDIQIYDCLSLMNQILFVQFSNKIHDKNTLELRNILIVQQLDSWLQQFSQMGNLSRTELLHITSNQNSLFYIESCSISIFNVIIEGLYLSPIFKIVNAPNLKIKQIQMRSIQLFYSFTLIYIEQMLDIETKMLAQQVSIINSSIYEAGPQRVDLSLFDFVLNGCFLVTDQSKRTQENQQFYYLSYILTIMEEHKQTQISLIYIQSLASKHSFVFNKLELIENDCQHCSSGLINFDLVSFQIIKIEELNCNYNIIQQYGCLSILGQNQVSTAIQILRSNFMFNRGSQGVAISSSRNIIFKQCKTIQNIATQKGGGLYLELNSNQFIIENSIIIGNQANEGGGLYFIGDSILDEHNLNQTYLLFNNASVYANNVVENPTHLALFINSQEMKADKTISEQVQTDILRITPYSTIDQEVKIKTYYLLIPSGQTIEDFSISIPKIQQTYKQIQQIDIIFKNKLNELQKNIINSSCIISDKIVNVNEEKVNGNLQNVQLLYNSEKSNFDLSTITFYFNPYQKDQQYLEISITCSTEGYKNQLKYIIQAKSYKCQLGEFHIDNGCQICQSIQGFYSVTYDAIKCSIFDKEKFQEITSNAIKLQPGYWRPNYLSDYSTLCFKITRFCVGGWNIGDGLCSKGHVGALCEECDIYNIKGNGYYLKNLQNSECLPCFGIQDSILPFILNTIWAILSITLTVKSIVKSNDLFLFLKVKERFSQILFKLNQDRESILIKMFLNYLWIFSLIFTFNISFSFQFNFVDSASNTSLSMANNLDCYLSQIVEAQLIYSKIILIIILILWQFIIIILGLMAFPNILNSKFKLSIISNILLCLYIFNYAGFIRMLCSAVSYREISNIQYIQGDLTLRFNTETHYQWMFYLVLPGLIIFGCLIPLSLFSLMYLKRNGLDVYTLRPHICYLFNEYVTKRYYWEQIKLSNKALIILFLTYFETNIHLKASLIGLSLICYQQFAAKKKPYIISKFNMLDLESGQKCSVSIFLAAIKYESEKQNNKVISLILQICLILLFFLVTFPFIYQIVKINYKKYQLLMFQSFLLIFKYLRFIDTAKTFEQILDKQNKKDLRLKENFNKLRKFLLVFSKAQIKNRPAILSRFNSSKNYQQNLLSTEIQGQSIIMTANRCE